MKKNALLRYRLIFAAIALFVPAIFGLAMVSITGGHLAAPLDDSYIHFQYARRLSQGHFYEYTEGSGFSTGATSVIYPFLLVPFFWLGLSGVKILLASYAIGAACFFISSLLIFRIGKDLAEERVGFLAGLLFLLNGNLAWNYLSGMETGVFATLLLAGFFFLIRWWEERRGVLLATGFLFLSLASLTRPEGFFILFICLVLIVPRAFRVHGSCALSLLLFLFPFLLYMVLVRIKTDAFSTAGLLGKSVTAAPYYTFWEKIAKLADNFALIFSGYYRNLSNSFFHQGPMFPIVPVGALYPFLLFPPGALFLALAGVVLGGAREKRNGFIGPALLVSIALFCGLFSVTNSEVVAAHYFRYLSPFQPLFLLLLALGVYEISKCVENNSKRIFTIAGTLLVVLIAPSVIYWAYIYGENCNDIFEQHRRVSWWIKDATPEDAVIGVTDTGVIGYFSDRKIYDFVGLTTPDQAWHWRQGLGSAFERLEHLPGDKLPDYIATFPFVWGHVNFLGTRVHEARLWKNLTTMSHEFAIFKQDWTLLHSGELPQKPPPGFSLVDSLDVADLVDEKKHEYRFTESSERPVGWEFPNPRNFFHKTGEEGTVIADGGRNLSDSETFTVRLIPGKSARLVARTESPDAAGARVYLNGKMVGRLFALGGRGASWQEPSFPIPAQYIKGEENRVRVVFEPERSRARSFHSYYYWFYQ